MLPIEMQVEKLTSFLIPESDLDAIGLPVLRVMECQMCLGNQYLVSSIRILNGKFGFINDGKQIFYTREWVIGILIDHLGRACPPSFQERESGKRVEIHPLE